MVFGPVGKTWKQIWNLIIHGMYTFQGRGTKLDRFLAKNQHNQRKWLYFVNRCCEEMSKSAKSDFQSQFSMSKIDGICFTTFFIFLEHQFRSPFVVKKHFPSVSYYFHIHKIFLNFFPHTGKNRNRRKSNLLP